MAGLTDSEHNEIIRVQEARYCLLCGDEGLPRYRDMQDRLFGLSGKWSLRMCRDCGFVWLDPRPIPEDIEKLYKEYCTHRPQSLARIPFSRLRSRVKNSILSSRFGYSVDGANVVWGNILSLVSPLQDVAGASVLWLDANRGGRLLDVGCGNGVFLANMRQLGWEVTGVEPDREAVRISHERFGLDVKQGTLEAAIFPNDYFDAITINHVLEHVPDPQGLIMECRRVLKPDGRLVVVTPNIGSLGRRVFGMSWVHWDPPRHLFLFSPGALQTLVERAGLKVVALRTTARAASSHWAYSYTIHRNGSLPDGLVRERGLGLRVAGMVFEALEHVLALAWPLGEELVLEAKK